ncbi:hypothetical protein KKHLCK_05460 [Candidatus Electrothrix laxa]
MGTSRKSCGRLKWNAVSVRDAQYFDEQELSSPTSQAPGFLKHLPRLSETYEPVQPVTKKLKKLIDEHAYAGAFQSAITTVSQQRIPELDRIHNSLPVLFLHRRVGDLDARTASLGMAGWYLPRAYGLPSHHTVLLLL